MNSLCTLLEPNRTRTALLCFYEIIDALGDKSKARTPGGIVGPLQDSLDHIPADFTFGRHEGRCSRLPIALRPDSYTEFESSIEEHGFQDMFVFLFFTQGCGNLTLHTQ